MSEVFGSVICDLPKNIFDELFAMNPFFVYSSNWGFCQMLHPGSRAEIPLVIFSQGGLKGMNWSQRRACVSHELAHLILGHLSRPFSLDDPYRRELEGEADQLCCDWGFQEEITSVRKYLKERS
jgi:hypothetical protein